MIANPFDNSRSWPDRPYGPSNFLSRPEEHRSQDSAKLTPVGLKTREVAIWRPDDLYREQIARALDAREFSPDSIYGLAELINNAKTINGSAESRSKVESYKEMLLWALRLYDKIPDEYKGDPQKGHRSLIQQNFTGEKIVQFLERNNFSFEIKFDDGRPDDSATSLMSYHWENAARVLKIVSLYLDETTRASS